ncbi:MAG: tetratricopeptide repeat protein [Ignavibacteria bacterium]|nr:tetratricopeptide repeat protein [Ignavibacteria bacterium]
MNNLIENIIAEIENKNYGKAIEYCDELILQQPQNDSVYEIKAGCYSALKDYKNACENYQKAIDNSTTESTTKNELAGLHEKKGRMHLRINEFENAVREFEKSLELNPDSADAHNDYAACLRRLDLYEKALEHSSKAIQLKPDCAEFYNNSGNINLCLGRIEESLQDYTKAIELNPAYANAYFNRGTLFFNSLKDSEKSKSDWQKAIELNPAYETELERQSPEISELLHSNNLKESVGPEIAETEVKEPEVKETEVKETEVKETEVKETEVKEPEVKEPEVKEPEVKEPEVKEPEVTEPEVEESKLDLTIDEPETAGISGESDKSEEKIENIADKISIIPLESMSPAASDSGSDLPEIFSDFRNDNAPQPFDSDILKPIDDGAENNLSFSEYSDIFGEKKSELNNIDDNDFLKPFDLNSDNNISFQDDTDILEPIGLSSESNLSFSEFKDIFDEKKTDVSEFGNVEDDINVPEIDFKSIFNDNSSEADINFGGEILTGKPLLTDEIKELHGEIEGNKTDEPELKHTDTSSLDSLSSKFSVLEKDDNDNSADIPASENHEDSKSWYSSPLFFVIIIGVILLAGLYTAYYFVTKMQPENTVTVNTTDTAVKTADKNKDTVSIPQTSESEEKTTDKSEQNSGAETKEEKTTESKFLGYLSEKNKFALFSEPDGFYVQIGSFKDKSAADESLKLLTNNNIKGSVFKADVKDKGILYRVRAGVFETQEEAKKVMSELEK